MQTFLFTDMMIPSPKLRLFVLKISKGETGLPWWLGGDESTC